MQKHKRRAGEITAQAADMQPLSGEFDEVSGGVHRIRDWQGPDLEMVLFWLELLHGSTSTISR
jgi:hypothetical protein